MKQKLITATFLSLSILLSACSRDMSSSTYVDSAASGVVLEGTVVSARPVKVKSADKLQNNGLGLLGGGVAGGVAGAQFGQGRGNAAATVGGVLAGAVLGSMLESELGQSDGMEYIVKINNDNTEKTYQKTNTKLALIKKLPTFQSTQT